MSPKTKSAHEFHEQGNTNTPQAQPIGSDKDNVDNLTQQLQDLRSVNLKQATEITRTITLCEITLPT